MSGGMLGQAVGVGMVREYLAPSEAMEQVEKALADVTAALASAKDSGHPEVFAHRARVVQDAAGTLAHSAYVLSESAYHATKK